MPHRRTGLALRQAALTNKAEPVRWCGRGSDCGAERVMPGCTWDGLRGVVGGKDTPTTRDDREPYAARLGACWSKTTGY